MPTTSQPQQPTITYNIQTAIQTTELEIKPNAYTTSNYTATTTYNCLQHFLRSSRLPTNFTIHKYNNLRLPTTIQATSLLPTLEMHNKHRQ